MHIKSVTPNTHTSLLKPIRLLAFFVFSICNQVFAEPTLFLFDLLPVSNTEAILSFEINEELEGSKSTLTHHQEAWIKPHFPDSEKTAYETYSWIFHLGANIAHHLMHRFPTLSPSVWMFSSSHTPSNLDDDDDVGPDTTFLNPEQEAEVAEMERSQLAAQGVGAEEAFTCTEIEVNSNDETALANCHLLNTKQIQSVHQYINQIRASPGYHEANSETVLASTFNKDRINIAGGSQLPQELNVLNDQYFSPNIDLFSRSGLGLFYLPSRHDSCPSSYRIVCTHCYRDLGSPGDYLNDFLSGLAHRCTQQGQPRPGAVSHSRPEKQNQPAQPRPIQPQVTDYRDPNTRQSSFNGLMHLFPSTQTAERFAAAGFFYAGNQQERPSDAVQCFSCNLILCRWQPDDEPEAEHKRHQQGYCDRVIKELDQVQVHRHQTLPAPQSSDFIESSARLASFSGVIDNFPGQTAQELADAGLYYTGESDQEHPSQDTVRCFHCRHLLYEWQKGGNPVDEHSKVNPKCQFIIKKIQERDQLAQLQGSFKNLSLLGRNSERAAASQAMSETVGLQPEDLNDFANNILSKGLKYDPDILKSVLMQNDQNLDDKSLIMEIYKTMISELSSTPDQEQHHQERGEAHPNELSDAAQSILQIDHDYSETQVVQAEAELIRQNDGTPPRAAQILQLLQERGELSRPLTHVPATSRSPLEEMHKKYSWNK